MLRHPLQPALDFLSSPEFFLNPVEELFILCQQRIVPINGSDRHGNDILEDFMNIVDRDLKQ